MAQNTFLNVTANQNGQNIADKTNIVGNVVVGAAAAASDFTISWDSAVITTLNEWDAAVAAARWRAISAGLT